MNNRVNKQIIPLAVAVTSLLFAGLASAQRSGQSMSVQTGIVVASPGGQSAIGSRARGCRWWRRWHGDYFKQTEFVQESAQYGHRRRHRRPDLPARTG